MLFPLIFGDKSISTPKRESWKDKKESGWREEDLVEFFQLRK